MKPGSLGDVVHTLPAVALLRQQYPELKIGWVVDERWASLLRGGDLVDGVVEFPRERFLGVSGFFGMWGWMRGLRDLRPDVALDFQGLFRSVWMGRASRAGELAGLGDGREGSRFCYDEVVPLPGGVRHAVDRYLALVAAGGVRVPAGREALEFPLPEGIEPPGSGDLPEGYVLFHPVSRGDGKSMPGDQVRRFCEEVGPGRVVVVGRVEEAVVSGWELPEGVVNLVNGTSLEELIWLARRASVVVTVDSGPMHVAAAVNARVLGIHTWTDPRKVGPYPSACRVWKAGKVRRVGTLEGDDDAALAESRADKRWALTVADVEEIASAVGKSEAWS
ncbi:MAG: glycosyltransferase family 9 protein [Verrucomicrobiota bacterium]